MKKKNTGANTPSNNPNNTPKGSSKVGFSLAGMLTLVTDKYASLEESVSEIIQNCCDAGGTTCEVLIDLPARRIIVEDNGKGCSLEEFDYKIFHIGESLKDPKNDIGRFGLGILAPADPRKCKKYAFTSAPKAKKGQAKNGWEGYHRHVFDEVMNHPETHDEADYYTADNMNNNLPWWNTQVVMDGIVLSSVFQKTFNIKRFIDDQGVKYGKKMKQTGIKIKVVFIGLDKMRSTFYVEPKIFHGKQLETFTRQTRNAGKIVFDLYLNDTPGNGNSLVFANGSSAMTQIPWSKYRNTPAAREHMDQTVFGVLDSNLFEGQIYAEKCEIRRERDGFNLDDALLDLHITFSEWAEKIGTRLVNKVRDEHQLDRYERIARQALAEAQDLIKGLNPELREEILEGLPGHISRGHTAVWGKETLPMRSEEKETREASPTPRTPAVKPRGENKDQIHGGVVEEEGQTRIASRKQPGFSIRYDRLDFDTRAKLDLKDGLIVINNRHPDFAQCEDRQTDTRLKDYVTLLIFATLAANKLPQMGQDVFHVFEKYFYPLMVNKIAPPLKRRVKKN